MGTQITSGFSCNKHAHLMGLEGSLSFRISIKLQSDVLAFVSADNSVENRGSGEFSPLGAVVGNMCHHPNHPHSLPTAEITNCSKTFSS